MRNIRHENEIQHAFEAEKTEVENSNTHKPRRQQPVCQKPKDGKYMTGERFSLVRQRYSITEQEVKMQTDSIISGAHLRCENSLLYSVA